MITKEQAMTAREFIQIHKLNGTIKLKYGSMQKIFIPDGTVSEISPVKWRANGKCQTWKTRPNEFKLPIKHGLYDYGYITHENAHLFEVVK